MYCLTEHLLLSQLPHSLQTRGRYCHPPARENGSFLQSQRVQGNLVIQRSLVHPNVPIQSLRVLYLPDQDLNFHMKEATNTVFSEVLLLLYSDSELQLKHHPPSGCCIGGLQTFTSHFISTMSLSFSLFNASVSTQNQPTFPLSFELLFPSNLSNTRDSA